MNAALAQTVLSELRRLGVREIVLCPAGRNAPFVELLTADPGDFNLHWHFEERSAAFFALGRARATNHPVVVCTTSGTAAGELLPAAMETAYSGVPLILLTADRPVRFRGSGAPQAAIQPGLFSAYVHAEFDFSTAEAVRLCDQLPAAPIHINVCFEDPNGAETSTTTDRGGLDAEEFFERYTRPLVIVGGLTKDEKPAASRFLKALGAPTYFEAPSGLRETADLAHLRLTQGDGLFTRARAAGNEFDSLIRIGSVPTHRLWRDLEDREAHLPVLNLSRLPFTGLGRPSSLVTGCLPNPKSGDRTGMAALLAADRERSKTLDAVFKSNPTAEQAQFRHLSEHIPTGSLVYLGNSLPIREWDLAATRQDRQLQIEASRGLNGIDGQVSTFLGLCEPEREAWAILGDLTALYDLAGPWAAQSLPTGASATIVVINNHGGRIFERMFKPTEFQNHHDRTFQAWAELWELPYFQATSVDQIPPALPGLRIVELHPDHAATQRVWEALK